MTALFYVVVAMLSASIAVNYRLFTSMMKLEDQLVESLDIIDSCYARLDQAAKTPLASEDPIVKEVLSSVLESRDALLLIANKITPND